MKNKRVNGHINLNLNPAMELAQGLTVGLIAVIASTATLGCDDSRACNPESYKPDGATVASPHMVCRDNDGDIEGEPTPLGDVCLVDYVEQLENGDLVFHCSNGSTITSTGGEDGLPGSPGAPGSDGSGCYVEDDGDYCTIYCTDSQTTFWCGDAPGGSGNPPGGGNPPPTGTWEVLAMGITGSDPLLTCLGVPMLPTQECAHGAAAIDLNLDWLANRTEQVWNGQFTELSLLGGAGYSEHFPGLIGGYCSVLQSASCGPDAIVAGLPVGAHMRLVNGQASGTSASDVRFVFEPGDQCPAVVCNLSIDKFSFYLEGMSQPMSGSLTEPESQTSAEQHLVDLNSFSASAREFFITKFPRMMEQNSKVRE